MNSFCVLFISLLISQSFGQDADTQPQQRNLVTNFLNQFLTQIFDELSTKNLSIPEIKLGDEVGKISNLQGSISGGLTKKLEDSGSFGFKLNTSLKDVILTAHYDIHHLDIPELFPVYGKGDAYIAVELINLNFLLDAKYDFLTEKFDIEVKNFKLTAVNSTVKFENLMNDPQITDFLNELISNLIPDLFEMLNEPLLKITEILAQQYGNGILKCIKDELFNVKECIEDVLKGVKAKEGEQLISSKLETIMSTKTIEQFVL